MSSRIFGYLSDSYLFHTVYVPSDTLFGAQFDNFLNPYEVYLHEDNNVPVATGWTVQDGVFVNTKSLEEHPSDPEDLERFKILFVAQDSAEIFLTISADKSTPIGATLYAAMDSGISVIDITDFPEAAIGDRLVDGKFISENLGDS